ncbi:ATP-utilizing enzymes of the PP-loop superfamily [Prochlorococcus marinus str. MIT 9515]|uniref:ATP-utilizing enzymes of the PP-loop superfamily n=2 Tax=Prochlorococcus marinus TaxID=1219 RepID=A2BYV4_PROM5|nr:ATP-utilizing enzymes of the PP-loop superfamily [Prochlorococcus marinus str. MIT 9515]
MKNLNSVCVAYSGGVDSTLVASLAFEQLGSKAIAVTGVSPALAKTLLDEAKSQAKWIGINHLEIETSELDQSSYSKNPKNRCFACKKELHKHTTYLSKKLNYKIVCDGVNLDDLGDYRPGIKAAKDAGVVSPLAKFNFTKKDIRDISRALGFPWWDKPAQPCLSSRFPYGNEITNERLGMVEKAEEYIKKRGISEVRVRCHGSTARIEIPKDEFKLFCKEYDFHELINYFSNLGFKCTSLDLEGLVSGKLNR